MLNFNDQGGQLLSSAKSCITPWRKLGPWSCPVHTRGLWGSQGGTAIAGSFLQSWTRFCPFSFTKFLPGAWVGWLERAEPSLARKEELRELRQQLLLLTQARNWGLWWDAVSPISNSAPGMLPAGAEHRSGDHPGIEPPSPAGGSPARWFLLQPLTHLPKMPALTSWQETATGKW